MCGIYCVIRPGYQGHISEAAKKTLKDRGPDNYTQCVEAYPVHDEKSEYYVVWLVQAASVLALRTEDDGKVVKQPYNLKPRSKGNLCWNGEIWSYDGKLVQGSDTKFIAERLGEVDDHAEDYHQQILNIIAKVRGPFAFVLYNRVNGLVHFGRDCVGRRSLVNSVGQDGSIVLSSVADLTLGEGWGEVDADGIYCLDLNKVGVGMQVEECMTKTPWSTTSLGDTLSIPLPWGSLNMTLPASDFGVERLHLKSPVVSSLLGVLRRSVELRLPYRASLKHPTIAVLFSGGLDCTLIARLIHNTLPISTRIDLLNVAFENPRVHKANTDGSSSYEACPDRLTARSSLAELQSICPGRALNLICVDIPYVESQKHKEEIRNLIHPHDTEMDLSIAMALYFAARGPTDAKVLFSGLGADELFGGYQRHAIAHKRGSYQGLLAELQLDTQRLGKRNLGRDDRAISRWAKEARYPFLDEDVINWAMKAPVHEKVGFGFTRGGDREVLAEDEVELDDKLVLRLIAKTLGLVKVSEEKKRAIQFGSRSAKMEKGRTKGTEKVA